MSIYECVEPVVRADDQFPMMPVLTVQPPKQMGLLHQMWGPSLLKSWERCVGLGASCLLFPGRQQMWPRHQKEDMCMRHVCDVHMIWGGGCPETIGHPNGQQPKKVAIAQRYVTHLVSSRPMIL